MMSEHNSGIFRSASKCESRILTPNLCQKAPSSFKLISGETGRLSWSSSSPSTLPMTLGVQPTVSASCATVQNCSCSWKSELEAQCRGRHGSSSAAGSQCRCYEKVSTGSQVAIIPEDLISSKPGQTGATNALPSLLNTSIYALSSRTRLCASNTDCGSLTSPVACSFESAPAAAKREKAVEAGKLMSEYVATSSSSSEVCSLQVGRNLMSENVATSSSPNGVCSVQVELEPSSDGSIGGLRTVGSPHRAVNASDKGKNLIIAPSDEGSSRPVQNGSSASFLPPSRGSVGESNPGHGNARCKAIRLPASVVSYVHTNSNGAVNTAYRQPVLLPAMDRGMLTIKVASSVMPKQQQSQSALFFVAPATTLQKVLLGDRGQASIVSVLPSPAGQASVNATNNFLFQPVVAVTHSTAHLHTQNSVESSASSAPVTLSFGFECQTKHLHSTESSSMLSNVALKEVSQVGEKSKIIALENTGLSSCNSTVTQTVKEKSVLDRYVKSSFMIAAEKAFNKIRLSDTLISEESDQRTLPTIVGYRSLVPYGSPSVVNAGVTQGPFYVATQSSVEHCTSGIGLRLNAPSKSTNLCSSISDPLLAGDNSKFRSLSASSDELLANPSKESVAPSEDAGMLTDSQDDFSSLSLANNRKCHDTSEPVKVQMSALHVAGGRGDTVLLSEISSATKSPMFVQPQQSLIHACNPASLSHAPEAKCNLQQVINTPSSMQSTSKRNPRKRASSPAAAHHKSRISKSSESKRGDEKLALEDRVKSLRALQSILLAEKKKQKAFVRKMYEKYATAAGPVSGGAVAAQVAAQVATVEDESDRKQDASGRTDWESSKIRHSTSFVSEACAIADRGLGSSQRGSRIVLVTGKLDSLVAGQSNAIKSLKEVEGDPLSSNQTMKGRNEKFSFGTSQPIIANSEKAKVPIRDETSVTSQATKRPVSRSSHVVTALVSRNVPAKEEDAKLLKKVEPNLCSMAVMDQNFNFKMDGNELDKVCGEVFKKPKSVCKDGVQSSGKRRSRELECLVNEHWNESWLKQEQKMRQQSKEKLSHAGTESCDVSVRENRALTYALARFAEMEQERRSAAPVAPAVTRDRKEEEVAGIKPSKGEDVRGKEAGVGESEPDSSRTSSIVLKRSREDVVAASEESRNSKKRRHGWRRRQHAQKQAQRLVQKAKTAAKVWKDQNAFHGFKATEDVINRSTPSCAAVRTTNVVVKRLSEAEIAKASKAYRKEFLLVPKYRGFLDFSPVVVESRTRGQRTSEDEVKLKKPEYPVLVVEGSNVDVKDVIVNQSEECAGDPSAGKKCSLTVNRTAGETILHKAARLGKVNLLEEQIRQGVDVNAVDNAGWSPLHEACAAGLEAIVKLLLQYGANPNCSSDSGVRPIHDAVQSGSLAVVRLLLMYGADARSIISSCGLPLHLTRNEKLHQFLEDFWIDQQVTDMPVDLKDFRKGKWQFAGSSSMIDTNDDARALLEGAPSDSADPDVASFQLSQYEYPMSFYLPCLKDRKVVGHRNYFYLPDLLKRLGISREAFLRQHKSGVRLEPWSTFQACVFSSQLSPLITHEMFDSQPFIELVCISNSAMTKLFSVTSLSV